MPPQQSPQFILESQFPVVFFLILDVLPHLIEIGGTHRKISVSTLPFKIRKGGRLLLQPEVGNALHFLYPICLGNSPPKPAKQMNVVFNTPDNSGRAFLCFGNPAEICMQLRANGRFAKKRNAFLCGKNQMKVNGG